MPTTTCPPSPGTPSPPLTTSAPAPAPARKCNVLLGNLREGENEQEDELNEKILEVFSTQLKIKLQPMQTVRVCKKSSDKDCLVFIKMKSFKDKLDVLRAAKLLKTSGMFIMKDLSKSDREHRKVLVKAMKKSRSEGKRGFIRFSDDKLVINGAVVDCTSVTLSKINLLHHIRIHASPMDLIMVQNAPSHRNIFPSTSSHTMHALQSKGVKVVATEIASKNFPLADRIAHFCSNWEAITQDSWVLQTILGFRIEFLQTPYQSHRPPQILFTLEEERCMQEEIQGMLNKHAISWIGSTQEGFSSQMFLVPKRDGRQRPVINLKQLNQSVKTEHFKMEGIHVLRDLLKAGDWMAKIDLKDAYFMVPMAKEDRTYLCFQWKGRAYQFNCLPFSLSSVPWVFTKTT